MYVQLGCLTLFLSTIHIILNDYYQDKNIIYYNFAIRVNSKWVIIICSMVSTIDTLHEQIGNYFCEGNLIAHRSVLYIKSSMGKWEANLDGFSLQECDKFVDHKDQPLPSRLQQGRVNLSFYPGKGVEVEIKGKDMTMG
jgi:hypothetical protein